MMKQAVDNATAAKNIPKIKILKSFCAYIKLTFMTILLFM